jgi:uncharacterized Zn-finger protein
MQVHIWNSTQVLSQIECNKAQKNLEKETQQNWKYSYVPSSKSYSQICTCTQREQAHQKKLLHMIYNSDLSSVYGLNMTKAPCKMYVLDKAHLYLVEVVNQCSVHFWANLTVFTDKGHYVP